MKDAIPKLRGELAFRRQAVAGFQGAFEDELFYLADDGIADAFTSHSFWLSGKTT